jgi:hypothetical protein
MGLLVALDEYSQYSSSDGLVSRRVSGIDKGSLDDAIDSRDYHKQKAGDKFYKAIGLKKAMDASSDSVTKYETQQAAARDESAFRKLYVGPDNVDERKSYRKKVLERQKKDYPIE